MVVAHDVASTLGQAAAELGLPPHHRLCPTCDQQDGGVRQPTERFQTQLDSIAQVEQPLAHALRRPGGSSEVKGWRLDTQLSDGGRVSRWRARPTRGPTASAKTTVATPTAPPSSQPTTSTLPSIRVRAR